MVINAPSYTELIVKSEPRLYRKYIWKKQEWKTNVLCAIKEGTV